jgi:hypothetical protein
VNALRRRQFLKALGLAGVAASLRRPVSLRAQVADVPQRVVFFVTPHGHVPSGWTMAIPGVPADVFAERSLAEAKKTDFGAAIRPLFPFRKPSVSEKLSPLPSCVTQRS